MKKSIVLGALLCFITLLAQAQSTAEICNDGIDNDGNGFIDCYDGACSSNTDCDGTFLGNDVACEAAPTAFPAFTMTLDFASPNETTNHLARMAVGDLDRDGIPEIITMNRYTDKVFVLDGRNGSIKHELSAPFDPQWEIAIANIDDDNCAEIFTFGVESGDTYLYSYNCTLTTQNWKREIPGDPINFGLADFNNDGKVELYAKDAIYDAHTGTRLVPSQNWSDMNGGPVAVDILGDSKLELVVGGYIYGVNVGNGTEDDGSLTELKKLNDYYIRFAYSATSVADYNEDGFLDVLISGSTGSKGQNTTIFFWDVQNNTVKTFFDNTTGAYLPNGWQYGTGRLNIADLDGVNGLNVSYVSGKFLYALDENLELLWRKEINEETSGHTGCTLFDFNADGKSEIVYRDEQFLYIINGTDGSEFTRQDCISRTNREYPIVADVDADGSTELCVPCGFDNKDAWDNFNTLSFSRYSHVRVFKSASEPWVPARRLWNQHGYFNVNVNDDLTIPRFQQRHNKDFSTGSCLPGQPNKLIRPLNTFLNQSPYLNSLGCPTYASPDLAHVPNSLTVNPPTCPNQNFTVSFQITNLGDVQLDGAVPITFYNGNPQLASAIKLNTVFASLVAFKPNNIFTVNNATVNGPGGPFTLYIVLNDNGTTIPLDLPNTNFVECDYNNNIISAPVTPLPVTLTALKVADNAKCIGSTSPDNGAVRAFIPNGAVENTADYNFFWFRGAVDATPDYTGAVYTGIPDGTYSVFARHKTAGCNSDTATVVVNRINATVTASINLISGVTNCTNPNGQLQAIANNGNEPATNFTFAWYEGNDIFTSPQIGVSATATNLKALTYTVLVTHKASGCQTVESFTVPNNINTPVVTTTQVDLLCSNANSGSATATVGGATAGFTFRWYNGNAVKPTADFTGSTYTNRPIGNYTVVAVNNTSGCISAPVTVTLVQTTQPTVTATVTQNQTSCDAALPNGAANASVGGATTGFDFEWFTGQNTLSANRIATTASVNNLGVGVYTVKATSTASGCFDTEEVTVTLATTTPVLSSTVVPVTRCDPYNGSITVGVSLDAPSDYTFSWYNGTNVKPAPDFTATSNQLPNLPPGNYTVRAVHNTKHCAAAPITVNVADNSPTISITLNSAITQLPSDCNSSDGVMGVQVSSPGNTLGFTLDWHFGREPFTAPSIKTDNGVTSSTASGLRTGVYTVDAVDLNSGCGADEEFYLPFANSHGLELIAQDDVQTCVPGDDGSATLELEPTPLAGFDEGDYDIFVYAGANDPGPSGTSLAVINGVVGQVNYTTANPLTPGFYTFVAVSNNPLTAGCRSVPVAAEILDATIDPVVTPTTNLPNVNCLGATGTGQLIVAADGASPNDYTFEWFNGNTIASPPLAAAGVNGEQVDNLVAGPYTVRVTNNTATSTGCFSVNTFVIQPNPTAITVAASGLTTVDLAACDLATGNVLNNGTAAITSINENGAAGNLSDYLFTWTNPAGTVLQNGPTASLGNLAAGIYLVQARNTNTQCFTDLQFEITDSTIGSTTVDLTNFINPERCVNPRNGQLTATAGGNSTSGYSFEWFAGTNPTGTVLANTNDLQGIALASGSIDHTVKVINNDNNCWAVDTYTLTLIVNEVLTSVSSSSPVTSCITDDGSVFGTVTNDNSLEYGYAWFRGTTTSGTPDFTGKLVNNLPAGTYTMVATDLVDTFCQSQALGVTLVDEKVIPVATAGQTHPVTNCDPAKVNGSASASVNGDVINYTFDWYAGTLASGPILLSGPEINSLSAGTYTVVATHRITGCAGSAIVAITESIIPLPNPDIEVLSNITSCVFNNGALTASVDGNTSDYIFNWYLGNAVKPGIDFTGVVIDSLSAGSYTVTATSRLTGCTTGPDTDVIVEDYVFPEFDFRVIPATCEASNGVASLVMLSNVPIESIVWNANGALVASTNLTDIPAGSYEVTVTSQLGCSTTRTVDIGTEIRPFNGVSRNGDGRNELFVIQCIENFPGNNVKIFNRAGTLVFEMDGYNNVDTYFDGKSNRGISPFGNGLPDGTYFYIIDKRDGSKPLAGYLELVR